VLFSNEKRFDIGQHVIRYLLKVNGPVKVNFSLQELAIDWEKFCIEQEITKNKMS